jgi:HlyD family secretion protein
MRLVVAAVLVCVLMVGLDYPYSPGSSAPTFITTAVERGHITTQVRANGTVEAVVMVDVSSQLSGRVAKVFVGFNESVAAGQPIAQLDQETFVARVDEARAALRVAKATAQLEKAAFERAKLAVENARTAEKLAEAQSTAIKAKQDELERELQRKIQLARTGSGTEQDLTRTQAQRDAGNADLRASIEQIRMKTEAIAIAEAERQMAEANLENTQAVIEQKQATLEQAQLDLDRAVVRAPIDGIIIKRDVNPGQTVAVSLEAKTLFQIAGDLHEMEVHGKIDEADVGQLQIGQTAEFTVDAYPDRTFGGRVLQIRKSPEVVQNVVTYTTIISAPNPDLLLLPGMTAQLRIVVSDSGDVLKIPNQALRFRPVDPAAGLENQGQVGSSKGSATVWVVNGDSRPDPVAVKLGASDDSGAALLEGPLTEGQQVITGVASSQSRRSYFGVRLGF